MKDFFAMIALFLVVFSVMLSLLLALAFQINVLWAVSFSDIADTYTRSTIPAEIQWEVFFAAMPVNLWICIPLAVVIGIGVVILAF